MFCFLTAKLQLFHVSCTFFFLSSLVHNWRQLCQYFTRVGVEPHVTFKVRKAESFLIMPLPRADLLWKMPHRGEGEVKKMPNKCPGRGGGGGSWARLELFEPLIPGTKKNWALGSWTIEKQSFIRL